MRRLLLIVLVLMAVVMAHSYAVALDAAFPKGIQIVPPGPDVSPDIGRLSGKWEGEWGMGSSFNTMNSKLAILVLSNNQLATLIFCWGDFPGVKGDCAKEVGDISQKEGVVTLEFDNPIKGGSKTRFLLNLENDRKNDSLKGYGTVLYGKMKRMTQ